jgi:hypothetical protein
LQDRGGGGAVGISWAVHFHFIPIQFPDFDVSRSVFKHLRVAALFLEDKFVVPVQL